MSEPITDLDRAHPIPTAWRPTLRAVVEALVRGDHALAAGVPSVAPVSPTTAAQMRDYLADHGETLVELPEEAWATSVAQWTGSHWQVLVDLWTDVGASDLVLDARALETPDGVRFELHAVYVP